jgi:hypothetical protein
MCVTGDATQFRSVDGVDYFECKACQSIFADPDFIADYNLKESIYDANYWKTECESARERSYGSSLNRVAELFLYARKPINKFLDIGSGPGYLLDAISVVIPRYSESFYGIELFPPPLEFQTSHKNYKIGSLQSLHEKFDGGCCIEVIEHLSPDVLMRLIDQLAIVSNPGAIYYINSAQPSFVRNVDPGYLDPHVRGHICSYSLVALEKIFSAAGFTVIPLPGRDWAFLVEFGKHDDASKNIETLMARVWNPVISNVNMLKNNGFGPFMYTVGVESARCYYESEIASQRTNWALSLKKQLFGI